MCTTHVQYPQSPEEGFRSPGTQDTHSCEPPRGCWEQNPGPVEEQSVHLPTNSAISPAHPIIFFLPFPQMSLLKWTEALGWGEAAEHRLSSQAYCTASQSLCPLEVTNAKKEFYLLVLHRTCPLRHFFFSIVFTSL